MRNKIYIRSFSLFFVFGMLAVFSLDLWAQNSKPSNNTQPPQTQNQPAVGRRFDPGKPGITQNLIEDNIKLFKSKLLEKKLPENISHHNTEDFITLAKVDDISIRLNYVAKHPDLEEVTGVSREWYELMLPGLDKHMMDLANRMDLARLNQDNKKYEQAKAAFEASQKDFLAYLAKTPGPKLDKEAMKKIKVANYKRREKEYDEQIKKAQPSGK